MLEQIQKVLEKIDDLVWGLPLIVLILATGILLTCLFGGLQVRHLGREMCIRDRIRTAFWLPPERYSRQRSL